MFFTKRHRLDYRDNRASGTSFARRFLSPLLLLGSCLTPKEWLVFSEGESLGGHLWAGVIGGPFFLIFLFAQVDNLGEGLIIMDVD